MRTKINLKMALIMAVLLVGIGCTIAAGGTIYVDADASPGGDGSSWGTAYKYLQDALHKPPTNGDQIWVAEGTYKPDEDEGGNVTLDDRTATFQLINGVAIYGGFAGGESSLDERDWEANETILSGDIGTPDVKSDNSYNVVTGSGTDATAVLDGFTITAGNANGGGNDNHGGGMYNYIGSPMVTNCRFSGNSAGGAGGGIYNAYSDPTVTNCTFNGNSANSDGGGMCNAPGSDPILSNCTFNGNLANSDGGAMYNEWSYAILSNCTFNGNSAVSYGGGMSNRETYSHYPILTNCTFTGNCATAGGGMANNVGSKPTLVNCTFSRNSASWYGGGLYSLNASVPTVTNCILWGDSAAVGQEIFLGAGSIISISYSDLDLGIYIDDSSSMGPCTSIARKPLFVREPDDGGDGWGDDPGTPSVDEGANDDFGDLRLSAGSPCIDAGNYAAVPSGITTDLDGNPRFFDDPNVANTGIGSVDMGAYERNMPSGAGGCGDAEHPYPEGDVNHDCAVDFYDIAIVAAHWLEDTGPE